MSDDIENPNKCSHEGCEKKDNLVWIGSPDSPPTYFCMEHFDVALRRVRDFVKGSRNPND